jgi:hypothetical protein
LESGQDESFKQLTYEHKPWGGSWNGLWGLAEFSSLNFEAEGFFARNVYEHKFVCGETPCLESSQDESFKQLTYEHKAWGGPWNGLWGLIEIPCLENGQDESISRLACDEIPCLKSTQDGFISRFVHDEIPCLENGQDESISRLAYDEIPCLESGQDESISRLAYDEIPCLESGQDESISRFVHDEIPCLENGQDSSFAKVIIYKSKVWDGSWSGLWQVGKILSSIISVKES